MAIYINNWSFCAWIEEFAFGFCKLIIGSFSVGWWKSDYSLAFRLISVFDCLCRCCGESSLYFPIHWKKKIFKNFPESLLFLFYPRLSWGIGWKKYENISRKLFSFRTYSEFTFSFDYLCITLLFYRIAYLLDYNNNNGRDGNKNNDYHKTS